MFQSHFFRWPQLIFPPPQPLSTTTSHQHPFPRHHHPIPTQHPPPSLFQPFSTTFHHHYLFSATTTHFRDATTQFVGLSPLFYQDIHLRTHDSSCHVTKQSTTYI